MQSSAELDLGFLLAELTEVPQTLPTLVIDEIERSLPEIISQLRIPPPLDQERLRVIEFRLAGRHGFRRLNSAERRNVTHQLENETFFRNLRKAQEIYSNGIHVGTTKRSVIVSTDHSEATMFATDSAYHNVPITEMQIPDELAPLEHQEPVITIATVQPRDLQRELPFQTLEGMASGTVNNLDDIEDGMLEIPDIPIELQEALVHRDIRDLLALLKGNILIGFIEPSIENLISKEIKKIRVPKIKLYSSLNLEQLIGAYHEIAASDEMSHESADELKLLDALIVAMEHEAQWSRINIRRFHLINKKYSMGLRPEELDELNTLDQLAERRMHIVQELPFAELATLKVYARRLGLEQDQV